ncbi:MAG: metal-dependent hydrolase [Actinomyces sp.]|uniref:metal-dependent hydrolase n=1 Tax=Actinomyces sp. TaxID=29317 RepID=UPI0026DD8452|nr:metal-dependent hydrolase [Actinomyces sp.]MDO4243527.1 metal-dependent hydrolase [Actinomyces sp.]
MMGRTHAITGVAAGMALFWDAQVAHGPLDLGPIQVPAGSTHLGLGLGSMSAPYTALMCLALACTALLPDLDTPSSLASTSIPPLTGWVSGRLAAAGHRKVTHSGVGIAVGAGLAAAVSVWVVGTDIPVRPGNGLLLGLCAAIGARAGGVGPHQRLLLWAAAASGTLMGAALPATSWWFAPASVAVGMWVHRIGDALTTQGVENLLWPVVRGPRLCVPLLGPTGSNREQALAGAAAAYAAWCGADLLLAAVRM